MFILSKLLQKSLLLIIIHIIYIKHLFHFLNYQFHLLNIIKKIILLHFYQYLSFLNSYNSKMNLNINSNNNIKKIVDKKVENTCKQLFEFIYLLIVILNKRRFIDTINNKNENKVFRYY